MKLKVLYGPSQEEVEALLNQNWIISSVVSELVRTWPDYQHNEQARCHESQLVFVLTRTNDND